MLAVPSTFNQAYHHWKSISSESKIKALGCPEINVLFLNEEEKPWFDPSKAIKKQIKQKRIYSSHLIKLFSKDGLVCHKPKIQKVYM